VTTNRRKPKRLAWALLLLAILGGWLVLRAVQDDGGTGTLEGSESVAESKRATRLLEGRAPGLAARGRRPEGGHAVVSEAKTEPDRSRLVKIEGVFRHAGSGEPVDAGAFILRWSPGPQQGRFPRPFDIALRTDALGRFRTEISLAKAGTPAATVDDIWTKNRRWRCHAFYPEAGKAGDSVIVSPETPTRIVVELAATITLKGVVVDPEGHPLSGVRIRYNMPPLSEEKIWSGAIASTGAEGTFVVDDILAQPQAFLGRKDAERASRIHFLHAGFVPLSLDALAVAEPHRLSWRVVLSRGLTIDGVLLDNVSGPLMHVEVEAIYADPAKRRTAFTDTAGRFTIETLTEGRLTLRALALDRELEAREEVTLTDSVRGLELFARPILPAKQGDPISVMGIRLANTTKDTRKRLGLPNRARVVVVDPGSNASASLEYLSPWELPAGIGLWKIGGKSVMIRIEYIHGAESDKAGSSGTEHFFLCRSDYRVLKRTAISLR